jgi:hypothetical protein
MKGRTDMHEEPMVKPGRSKVADRPTSDPQPAAPPGPNGEEELLIDGQEEVFSRAEIENGVIEHKADT